MSEKLATVHELHPAQHSEPDINEVNAGLVRYELDKHKEAMRQATKRQEAITAEFNRADSAA